MEHCYYNQLLPGSMIAFSTLLENVLNIRGWKKKLYLGDQLDKLKMPVYFIWGDKDVFESPETGIKKSETIVDHFFEVVENAGHCSWLDQPQKCSSLIISMLNN